MALTLDADYYPGPSHNPNTDRNPKRTRLEAGVGDGVFEDDGVDAGRGDGPAEHLGAQAQGLVHQLVVRLRSQTWDWSAARVSTPASRYTMAAVSEPPA